jgi:hypothetical protein
MPIALVTSVMPVLFILAITVFGGGHPGSRAIFALAAMTALVAFVFVQFLRSARDLDDER